MLNAGPESLAVVSMDDPDWCVSIMVNVAGVDGGSNVSVFHALGVVIRGDGRRPGKQRWV